MRPSSMRSHRVINGWSFRSMLPHASPPSSCRLTPLRAAAAASRRWTTRVVRWRPLQSGDACRRPKNTEAQRARRRGATSSSVPRCSRSLERTSHRPRLHGWRIWFWSSLYRPQLFPRSPNRTTFLSRPLNHRGTEGTETGCDSRQEAPKNPFFAQDTQVAKRFF